MPIIANDSIFLSALSAYTNNQGRHGKILTFINISERNA